MYITSAPALETVIHLLEGEGLPTDDIRTGDLKNFFVARDKHRVFGVIGVELFEACALIRSLAVLASQRGKGLGSRLLEKAENFVKDRGVYTTYILTTTATLYFAKYGYISVTRDAAPTAIRQTAEFKSLCPDSAQLMKKILHDSGAK